MPKALLPVLRVCRISSCRLSAVRSQRDPRQLTPDRNCLCEASIEAYNSTSEEARHTYSIVLCESLDHLESDEGGERTHLMMKQPVQSTTAQTHRVEHALDERFELCEKISSYAVFHGERVDTPRRSDDTARAVKDPAAGADSLRSCASLWTVSGKTRKSMRALVSLRSTLFVVLIGTRQATDQR